MTQINFILLIGFVAFSLTSCSSYERDNKTSQNINPEPRLELPTLTPKIQYSLGQFVSIKVFNENKIIKDRVINRYLGELGNYLSLHISSTPIKGPFPYDGFKLGLYKSKTPQLISAPGGFILLSTGMMEMLDNEDQLALVLAHGMGHSMGEHGFLSLESVARKEALKEIEVAFNESDYPGLEKVQSVGDSIASSIIKASYSLSEEILADEYAFHLAYKAGYAPKEMFKILAKLKALPSDGGFLSKHPSGSERVSKLRGISSKIKNPRKPASFRVSKYGQIKKRLQRL